MRQQRLNPKDLVDDLYYALNSIYCARLCSRRAWADRLGIAPTERVDSGRHYNDQMPVAAWLLGLVEPS